MADQHPSKNGRSKKTILAEERALQAMPELPIQILRTMPRMKKATERERRL